MIKDVDPEFLKELNSKNRLGKLLVKIPFKPESEEKDILYGTYRADLKEIYQTILKPMSKEDIFSVCLIGSILYKSFTDKDFIELDKAPSDFDLLVLTKDSPDKVDIVIPKRVIKPIMKKVPHAYGSYDIVETSIIETKIPYRRDRTFLETICREKKHGYTKGAIDLHIDYRSISQFEKGLGKGDTISESAFIYGVPIIGKANFESLIEKNPVGLERKVKHEVIWEPGSDGKTDGEVI